MKQANYAVAAVLAFAMGSASASADEQHATSKSVPQPTVMSDAQLDQIVGAGAATFETVSVNRTKAFENSGYNSQAVTSKSQGAVKSGGQGEGLGASGAWFGISLNPSP
jgi:hypothetical protein